MLKHEMIPMIYGEDVPEEFEEYLSEQEIYTHCQHGLYDMPNDDSPFCKWLEESGISPSGHRWIAIVGS